MPSGPTNPRWSFREPSRTEVERFLALQEQGGANRGFSYVAVGASRDDTARPLGYNLDHNRVLLGRGESDFEAACAALRAWRMFPSPWTRISPPHAPIATGQVVAMQAHALGLWWLNACRIVYVIDGDAGEAGCRRRFGFAYGTLWTHVEQGEERFSVEWRDDDSVWYDLRAFSRPRFWPVRIGKPLARRLQMRFVRESKTAMQAAVAAARETLSEG